MIIIDQELLQMGIKTSVDGFEYCGGGLNAGECGLRIKSLSEHDLGQWSCTLLTTSGQLFGGNVTIDDGNVRRQ